VADLVTHGALALIVKSVTRGAMPAVFVFGTVMPDLFSRVPAIVMGYIHVHVVSLPPLLTYGWQPLHQPFGMLLLAYVVTMCFAERLRRDVFWNLAGGMALHLGVDLLQDHHGAGYQLGFPFWSGSFEFALMGSEATVLWSLPLGLVAWLLARKRLASS
jgi:hypothetical protein